jgi:hypothetical protein
VLGAGLALGTSLSWRVTAGQGDSETSKNANASKGETAKSNRKRDQPGRNGAITYFANSSDQGEDTHQSKADAAEEKPHAARWGRRRRLKPLQSPDPSDYPPYPDDGKQDRSTSRGRADRAHRLLLDLD